MGCVGNGEWGMMGIEVKEVGDGGGAGREEKVVGTWLKLVMVLFGFCILSSGYWYDIGMIFVMLMLTTMITSENLNICTGNLDNSI